MLFIFVFLIQEPSLSKAGYFERDVYFVNQRALSYSFQAGDAAGFAPQAAGAFAVQYWLNGGKNAKGNPLEYSQEDLPIVLDIPTKEGYNFAGWYTDSGFSKKIGRIDEGEARNHKLYAKWTKCIDSSQNLQTYSYHIGATQDATTKKAKNCSYGFLENVKIPGMPSTREEDRKDNRIADTSQCPQGICFANEYLLISSYSGGADRTLGCIHVFDRESGEYLATLGMKERSHLGGLAFDGESVWACNSNNSALERIPYAFIKQVASCMPQSIVDCSKQFAQYRVSNAPSCIAYYDGLLWVATHTRILNSKAVAYQVEEDGLRPVKSCRIPDKVQGIAFDEEGAVYVSTSYGRKQSSYLKVYASIEAMDDRPSRPRVKVEMPPCSEELEVSDGSIYILFESAGEKYLEGTDGKGKSVAPLDKILVLSKKSI